MCLVNRRRPLTFRRCATAAACSCTRDLVLAEGSAAAAVAAAILDLVLLDGGLLETCVVHSARRGRARSRFYAILLTGLAVCC